MAMLTVYLYLLSLWLKYGFCAVPTSEHDALMDIYDSTNGDQWITNDNWATNDECTWYGIGCHADKAHVMSIDLSNNGLNGSIANSIGNFTELTVLQLYGNKNNIYGTLPETIGELTKLLIIDLEKQHFSGPIPESLGKCISLIEIHFNNNQFTSIPESISNLGPLDTLSITSNHMINVSIPLHGPVFDCDCNDKDPCNLEGNTFICPIPQWAQNNSCHANCV
eukprot:182161_1